MKVAFYNSGFKINQYKTILKTDTAAISVLAIVQYELS